MSLLPRSGSLDAAQYHLQAVQDLQPAVDAAARGLNPLAQTMMRTLISNRPVHFWNEAYLIMARDLAGALYLIDFYQKKEHEAAHKGDLDTAKQYSALITPKHTMARQLMTTLQLSPSQIHGESRDMRATVKAQNKSAEILEDENEDDLYA